MRREEDTETDIRGDAAIDMKDPNYLLSMCWHAE